MQSFFHKRSSKSLQNKFCADLRTNSSCFQTSHCCACSALLWNVTESYNNKILYTSFLVCRPCVLYYSIVHVYCTTPSYVRTYNQYLPCHRLPLVYLALYLPNISLVPTVVLTLVPTIVLSLVPTMVPSLVPTAAPSDVPSNVPSDVPSSVPSAVHSSVPSVLWCT